MPHIPEVATPEFGGLALTDEPVLSISMVSSTAKNASSSVSSFMVSKVTTTVVNPRGFTETVAPSSRAFEDVGQFIDDLESVINENIETAVSSQIVRKDGANYEVITDLITGEVISSKKVSFSRGSVREIYTTKDGMSVTVSKADGQVLSKEIFNADKTQKILIDNTDNASKVYVTHYGNGFANEPTYIGYYDKENNILYNEIGVSVNDAGQTVTETRLYSFDGVVGKVKVSGERTPFYYEISDCTNGQKVEVPVYTEEVGQFYGLKRKSLFNALPKFD